MRKVSLTIFTMLVLTLTGCGGGGSGSSTSTEDSTPDTANPTETQEVNVITDSPNQFSALPSVPTAPFE